MDISGYVHDYQLYSFLVWSTLIFCSACMPTAQLAQAWVLPCWERHVIKPPQHAQRHSLL